MRIAAMLVIIIAAGYGGLLLSHTFHQRSRQLENIAHGLQLLETEMFFARYPLLQAFENVIPRLAGEVAVLFQRAVDQLKNEDVFRGEDALLAAIEQRRPHLSLREEDWEILCRFAQNLGVTDLADQQKKLATSKTQLSVQIAEARAAEEKWGRICSVGGWLAGIALALVCI